MAASESERQKLEREKLALEREILLEEIAAEERKSVPQQGADSAVAAPRSLVQRIVGALGATKDTRDYRGVPGSGALTANTELGMGGLTAEEVQAAGSTAMRNMATMGLRAGLPTVGQVAGAATGPFAPIAVPALGSAGGAAGEYLAQLVEGGDLRPGAITGAGVAGAIPASPMASALGGAAKRQLTKEAIKQAGGNVAAISTEAAMDRGGAPSLAEVGLAAAGGVAGAGAARAVDGGGAVRDYAIKKELDAVRRETLKLGKELGYVVPPSVVSPGVFNDTLGSVAGKAQTAQQVVHLNQPITDNAVREELGVGNRRLNDQVLNSVKLPHEKKYAEAASVSPTAAVALKMYKDDQAAANIAFARYRDMFPKDPRVLEEAKTLKAKADAAFNQLEAEATKAGKKSLGAELKDARVNIAKIEFARSVMNKGDGTMSAVDIGKAYEAGEKLTGNFEKIGRFQNAFGKAVLEASKTPPSGVNQLMQYIAPVGGAVLAGQQGGMGAAAAGAAAMMFAPRATRESILSQGFQRFMANPNYGPVRPDAQALLARFAAMAEGRDPNVIQQQQPAPRPVPFR